MKKAGNVPDSRPCKNENISVRLQLFTILFQHGFGSLITQ
jgi:hypothetical protein